MYEPSSFRSAGLLPSSTSRDDLELLHHRDWDARSCAVVTQVAFRTRMPDTRHILEGDGGYLAMWRMSSMSVIGIPAKVIRRLTICSDLLQQIISPDRNSISLPPIAPPSHARQPNRKATYLGIAVVS
ncbi:hypothetical protein CVT26_001309 [Gymnopilus dilepis]|uniref:Uncharacterized protein n=1 Tax=Gymnopilus dilepis TaxID=231916 RepID=A0A409Y1V6_9AGAR|nr:hypothetical protein CVT26_001309 [Gymnopilus dilepis]